MANRHAPGRAKYLVREPRTLVVSFTAAGDGVGVQTLAAAPYNHGVVNVVGSATGIIKVNLGSTGSSRDSYAYFAGMEFCSDEADRKLAEVTNVECNHATDPNITFQITDTDDVDQPLTNDTVAYIRLHFLDCSS